MYKFEVIFCRTITEVKMFNLNEKFSIPPLGLLIINLIEQ